MQGGGYKRGHCVFRMISKYCELLNGPLGTLSVSPNTLRQSQGQIRLCPTDPRLFQGCDCPIPARGVKLCQAGETLSLPACLGSRERKSLLRSWTGKPEPRAGFQSSPVQLKGMSDKMIIPSSAGCGVHPQVAAGDRGQGSDCTCLGKEKPPPPPAPHRAWTIKRGWNKFQKPS